MGEQQVRKEGAKAVLAEEEPPRVTPNAMKVLERRYLAKADDGKTLIETPKDLFWRVAYNLAEAERNYGAPDDEVVAVARTFYRLMGRLEFLPNSPTLMNAGRELQQLSACFVLPVPDSIDGIFEAVKQQAIIHKTGGGTGFSFSRIRPKNDIVRTTSGVASGPISFMKIFNTATEQIKQGGTRRGANMAILRIDHPDIVEFIDMKTDLKEMTNFNVSVALTDRFMKAWERGEKYDLLSPKTGAPVGQLDARVVMDKIAHNAWISGEPGLFFIDRANAANPVPHVAEIEATNPCGEQDLMPYDSCNLGSVVLDKHMREVRPGKFEVDWDHLRQTVHASVRILDNVIDMNAYPLPEIQKMSRGTRRIGLGIMGFARMLFKLEVPYDSEQGVDMAEQVMRFIATEAQKASEELATTRGPYGFWEGSVHQKKGVKPRRNAYITTIAPTGTISMIADTSGGCEPEYSLIWYKNVMDGTHLPYVLEYFEEVARREGFWYESLMDEVLKANGSCRNLAKVPKKWQQIFATAMDITPEWHVRMQGAFQKHIDAQVSKTINLPKTATEDDVKKSYTLAYKLGCRGITVYRDGSRDDQVLNLGVSTKDTKGTKDTTPVAASAGQAAGRGPAPPPQPVPSVTVAPEMRETIGTAPSGRAVLKPRARPDVIVGTTQKIETGYGSLYVTINEDEHGIFEIFATLGKSGGYTSSFTEAVARLASLALRSGVPPEEVAKQLEGIRSPKIGFDHRDKILSVPDGIAKALRRQTSGQLAQSVQARLDSIGIARPPVRAAPLEATKNVDTSDVDAEETMQQLVDRGDNPDCPDCGGMLALQEGCVKCQTCGYSEC